MTELTMWAVFDKDGNDYLQRLFVSERSAINYYESYHLSSWNEVRDRGYYAAPAKIVEVK